MNSQTRIHLMVLLAVIVTTSIIDTPALASLSDGLIAYYPLNGSGVDQGPNGLHGTVQGAQPTTDRFGTPAGALMFDGNDSVSIPDNSALTLGSGDFTIAAWVKFTQDGNFYLLGHSDGGGNNRKWILWPGSGLRFHVNSPATGGYNPAALGAWTTPVDQWVHLAARRSGSTFELFVNGVPVATGTDSRPIPDPSAPLLLGSAEGGHSERLLRGSLDEVRLYARALSDTELSALSSSEREIVVNIEEPSCNGASGVSNIRGFAFTTQGGIERLVQVTFDRGTSHEAQLEVPCCSSRGDVKDVYPAAPRLSGFSGIFNWCLLTPGLHTITLAFASTSGKTLTVTREFISYCEHPGDSFLTHGEFDWRDAADRCDSAPGGIAVCEPDPKVCDGQVRYEWSQAAQGLVLKSNCVPNGFEPPAPPSCSDEIVEEEGSIR